MKLEVTEEQIDELIEVLNLSRKQDKQGNVVYKTLWGNKSEVGLRETIKSILKLEK